MTSKDWTYPSLSRMIGKIMESLESPEQASWHKIKLKIKNKTNKNLQEVICPIFVVFPCIPGILMGTLVIAILGDHFTQLLVKSRMAPTGGLFGSKACLSSYNSGLEGPGIWLAHKYHCFLVPNSFFVTQAPGVLWGSVVPVFWAEHGWGCFMFSLWVFSAHIHISFLGQMAPGFRNQTLHRPQTHIPTVLVLPDTFSSTPTLPSFPLVKGCWPLQMTFPRCFANQFWLG